MEASKKIKILFLACAYNRPKILRLALMGLNRLKEIHDFDTLIACSDSESVKVCEEFGVNYFEFINLPIGVKKNELFRRGVEGNYDYYIEFADDDLMTNLLFEKYIELMEQGENYIRPKGLYFYDTTTKKGLKFNPSNTFGAFRVFSRELIENVGETYAVTFRQQHNQFNEGCTYEIKKRLYDYLNHIGIVAFKYQVFNIWENELNYGLDFSSETRIIEAGYEPFTIDLGEPHIIDIKSEQNIWQFKKYTHSADTVAPKQIFKLIGQEEIDYINEL